MMLSRVLDRVRRVLNWSLGLRSRDLLDYVGQPMPRRSPEGEEMYPKLSDEESARQTEEDAGPNGARTSQKVNLNRPIQPKA